MRVVKRLLLISILVGLFGKPVFADSNATISFKRYADSTCKDYTGTWVGFISDPKYAKAWPVIIGFYNEKDKVVGKITSTMKLDKSHKTIWADCANGNLTNIFWGEKGICGSFAQEGFHLDKHVAVIKLRYETPKEDTYFVAFLNKKNGTFLHPIPKTVVLGKIQACHANKRY